MWRYLRNVLIGVDQLGNTLAGGDPDETISSRLGKIKRLHKGKIPFRRHPLAWVIDRGLEEVDPGHSLDSIDDEEGGDAVFTHAHEEKEHERQATPEAVEAPPGKVRPSDGELEKLVYSVLQRCPYYDDLNTARKIVDAILLAEAKKDHAI